MKYILAILIGGGAVSLAAPAHAHHSAAMYDDAHTVVLSGTVREFQWTNPHCWIQLVVPRADGKDEWSIELGAPIELMRFRWNKRTLKPGDAATITIHPLRNGGKGGQFVSGTGPNGAPLGIKP